MASSIVSGPVAFRIRIVGAPDPEALVRGLLDLPIATDEELARLAFVGDDEVADATILGAIGPPPDDARAQLSGLGEVLFVALTPTGGADEDALRDAWAAIVPIERVHLASRVDELRAALLEAALARIALPVERARRQKRPYALAIIAGAAGVTAAEALLPGAAAFVVATQASAVSSLFYLYTGRWMARTQALALLPAFAAEAAGGSVFLLVKSFLPPTGVADVLAAGVAASMTLAVLGTVAWALDQGYSLEETDQLRSAFKRLRARTRAERHAIATNPRRWKEKAFWMEIARRVVFPPGT